MPTRQNRYNVFLLIVFFLLLFAYIFFYAHLRDQLGGILCFRRRQADKQSQQKSNKSKGVMMRKLEERRREAGLGAKGC
jgi:hypothetical protein